MAVTGTPLPNNTSVGPILVGLTTGLVFFVLLTTFLRVFVRIRNRAVSWDDYLMIVATVFSLARWAIQVVQVSKYGQGKHRIFVSEENYERNNRLGWWSQLCLFTGLAILKMSIMMLILRIKNTKTLRRILYTAIAGLVVINLAIIVIFLAECRPVGYWHKNAVCWPTEIRIYTTYVTIAYSIVTDFLCSLLPLVVVWNIRIPRKTKVMVCSLMSLGLLATGFGIARAKLLDTATDDLSWTYARSAFWANLEFYLGIIAGNLAISYQIFRHFVPSSRRGTKQTRSSSSYRHPGSTDDGSTRRFARKLRDPTRDDDMDLGGDTMVESGNRRSSWCSERSGIPMERIRKKTEVWISESSRDEMGEGSGEGPAGERRIIQHGVV